MQDISLENKGWDLDLDTEVDLFIIAGTTLKTQGTLKLVKAMAQNVHQHGGAVIYVDLGEPSKKILAFVDVHFRMDVNVFCEYVGEYTPEGLLDSSANFYEQIIRMAEDLPAINTTVSLSPPLSLSDIADERREGNPLGTIKFILLHTSRNGMEADAYGQAVMYGIHRKGYKAELIQQRIGSFNHIPVVQTQGCHTLVAFLTSSMIHESSRPASQDVEVAEMLYFIRRMIPPQTGMLSANMVLFGHYEAFNYLMLAQRLQHEIRDSVVGALVCGLAVASSDHLLWADWTVRMVHNWALVSDSVISADDELDAIKDSWLDTDGLYMGTNLWNQSYVICSTLLLIAPGLSQSCKLVEKTTNAAAPPDGSRFALAAPETIRFPGEEMPVLRAIDSFVFLIKGKPIALFKDWIQNHGWAETEIIGAAAMMTGPTAALVQVEIRQDPRFRKGEPCFWLTTRLGEYAMLSPHRGYTAAWDKSISQPEVPTPTPSFHRMSEHDPMPTWWDPAWGETWPPSVPQPISGIKRTASAVATSNNTSSGLAQLETSASGGERRVRRKEGSESIVVDRPSSREDNSTLAKPAVQEDGSVFDKPGALAKPELGVKMSRMWDIPGDCVDKPRGTHKPRQVGQKVYVNGELLRECACS
ncbi:hypothetical protein RSOL_036600, partial [Rhizoctonia solani AG-3 Rhs1AP]